MAKGLVASARITVNAPVTVVWDALVNPAIVKQYMFGTEVVSDWKKGSSIVWRGTWEGRKYEDRGRILKIEKNRTLSYDHFSPLSGMLDLPKNHHTVTIDLRAVRGGTEITLSQDNNSSEEARGHSQKNWEAMLLGLKKLLE